MPSGNLVVRNLAPLVAAMNGARSALYRPPQTTITGIDESLWPNPLQPVTPMGPPRAEPLGWPFDWGRNLIFTPRDDAEYSASQLRQLATYPLARICIENTKDMISRMPYRIQLKPLPGETSKARADRSKNDKQLGWLNDFFSRPNRQQNWQEFLRPVLDDMLVIDAASIFIGRDKKGKVQELRWIEGASITCLVDEHGWRPAPPNPAYQQLWQGYPRIDLTTDQLIYAPRNIVPRNTQASYLYGMSPVEQIAKEIKIGAARLQFIYDFYREGSIPGMIHFVPPNVSVEKIKEAQQYLDSAYAGNLPARRRLQLIQGWHEAGQGNEQTIIPKEPALADAYDELHTRRICFAFGTSPQRLMRQMNRASAQVAQLSAEEEGTLPWMEWLKSVIDNIIQNVLGMKEYEFAFDPYHEMDRMKQSQADEKDVDNGIYTRNEVRERRGDDPRPEPLADTLSVKTAQGVVPLGQILQPTAAVASGSSSGTIKRPTITSSPGGGSVGKSKTNGHTTHATCAKHKDSYPRAFCADCSAIEAIHYAAQQEALTERY